MSLTDSVAVHWLTQHMEQSSYAECKNWIRERHYWPAFRYWDRSQWGRRDELPDDALLFFALAELQERLLEQYVPALVPGRTKQNVTMRWPNWGRQGVRVALDGRSVAIYKPDRFPAHGSVVEHHFEDGGVYQFNFYRSDTERSQENWFRFILRGKAKQENPREKLKMDQMDDDTPVGKEELLDPFPDENAELGDRLEDEEFIKNVRSMMDSKVYELAVDRTELGKNHPRAKPRYRARLQLRKVAKLVQRAEWDKKAEERCEKLMNTPDGERAGIFSSLE